MPAPEKTEIQPFNQDEFEQQIAAIRAAQPKLEELVQIADPDEREAFIKKLSLPLLIDMAVQQREVYRAQNKVAEESNKIFKELEWQTICKMEASGSDENPLLRAGGLLGSASITEEIVQNVDPDMWPSLQDYLKENDLVYLLQKRLSSKAVTDYLSSGNELPGVSPFIQKKLNLRRV